MDSRSSPGMTKKGGGHSEQGEESHFRLFILLKCDHRSDKPGIASPPLANRNDIGNRLFASSKQLSTFNYISLSSGIISVT